MLRFGFPYYQALYGFVEDQGITVYTVGKRDLYPEKELENALTRVFGNTFFNNRKRLSTAEQFEILAAHAA